jgi:hypothetical protein
MSPKQIKPDNNSRSSYLQSATCSMLCLFEIEKKANVHLCLTTILKILYLNLTNLDTFGSTTMRRHRTRLMLLLKAGKRVRRSGGSARRSHYGINHHTFNLISLGIMRRRRIRRRLNINQAILKVLYLTRTHMYDVNKIGRAADGKL